MTDGGQRTTRCSARSPLASRPFSGTATSSRFRRARRRWRAAARCLQGYRIADHAWGIQFHAEVSRADAQAWIDDYESDEDAVRIGLDPDLLHRRTDGAIDAWNGLGRALCERFLDVVATRA